MLGLFHGRPGTRAWRRVMTLGPAQPGAAGAVIEDALAAMAGEGARLAA
jgi:tRNA-dihydrouridine synthase A